LYQFGYNFQGNGITLLESPVVAAGFSNRLAERRKNSGVEYPSLVQKDERHEFMKVRVTAILFSIHFFVACSTSSVVPCGPDTYSVSSSGAGFSTGGVRARAYKAANDFCSKRGLVMMPVSFDAQGGVYGQRPPTADLVFRALPPGDPEIKRPNVEGPQVVHRVLVR
jgi:hypothetical protein